jgi:hypothetical protein
MKRGTRVHKPRRGEQEPFARRYAEALKENERLRAECASRIEAVERKAGMKIDAACAERDGAETRERGAKETLAIHVLVHKDFARVAPVLRSRSFLRRLWWALRFAAWGVFRFEVSE